MNFEELHEKATAFRTELERYYRRNPDVSHSTNFHNPTRGRFPLDHCKAAAYMFGEYLTNHCGVDSDLVSYVWGTRNDETHGWLMYDGWIVDLTPDQFEDEERKVIVNTEGDSTWNQSFSDLSKHPFNLRRNHDFVEVADEIARRLE